MTLNVGDEQRRTGGRPSDRRHLIATGGDGVCFLVNAASFVAVVISLLVMDKSALRPSVPEPRAKGQLRQGFAYALRTTDILVPLVMMGLVGMLTYEFQVSLPVFATRTFHGGSIAYGFMTASMGFGAVAGGLITAARGRTGVRTIIIAAAGFGLAILFTALAPFLAPVVPRAGPGRLGERLVHLGGQLDDPAELGAEHARPDAGAVAGRLPGDDADRRARSSAG